MRTIISTILLLLIVIAPSYAKSNDSLKFRIEIDKSQYLPYERIDMEFTVQNLSATNQQVTCLNVEFWYSLEIELTKMGDTTFNWRGGNIGGPAQSGAGQLIQPEETIRHIYMLNYFLGYESEEMKNASGRYLPPGEYKVVGKYHSNPEFPFYWSEALKSGKGRDISKLRAELNPRRNTIADTLSFSVIELPDSVQQELSDYFAAIEIYNKGMTSMRDVHGAFAAVRTFYSTYPNSSFNSTIIRSMIHSSHYSDFTFGRDILYKYSENIFICELLHHWIHSEEEASEMASEFAGTRIEYYANEVKRSILWRKNRKAR